MLPKELEVKRSNPARETLLATFSNYLDRNPKHKGILQQCLMEGLAADAEGKNIKLNTGKIDRVFDNLQKTELATVIDAKSNLENFRQIMEADEKKQIEIITAMTKKTIDLLTTNGETLRSDLIDFLNKQSISGEEKFSEKYKKLSPDNQEKVRNCLIFSLTHAVIMSAMDVYQATITQEQQVAMVTRLKDVAKKINDSISSIKEASSKEKKLQEELFTFVDNCILLQTGKIDDKNLTSKKLNEKAKELNQKYGLNIKFDSSRLAASPQDQLLKFINTNHSQIIITITEKYAHAQKGFINPEDVIFVLEKAGAKDAAKAFESFVRDNKDINSPSAKSPRK